MNWDEEPEVRRIIEDARSSHAELLWAAAWLLGAMEHWQRIAFQRGARPAIVFTWQDPSGTG